MIKQRGVSMPHGRYSDDLNEDSLFREDEQRLIEETEKEIRTSNFANKGNIGPGLFVVVMLVLFFLWFFLG